MANKFLTCGAFALLASSFEANASGFLVFEQNASAFGTGYAGAVTSINDPSTLFYNPSGITRCEGTQVVAVGNFLFPKSRYEDGGSSTTISSVGTFTIPGKKISDGGAFAAVPNLYASHQLNDRLFFGFGVSAPFGLKTEYDKNWVGRYLGIKSDLKTIVMNPTVAFKINDRFSVGAGIVGQYANADLDRAIDFGGLGRAGVTAPVLAANGFTAAAVPGGADGNFRVKADGWAIGFNLGATVKPFETTTLGLSFRSATSSTIKGSGKFKRSPLGDFLSNATGRFVNTKVKADLDTPEMLILGAKQEITDKWRVMGDVMWVNWKRFKELRVRFSNPRETDAIDEENWKDAWRFALGTEYDVMQGLTLKLGGGFDGSPVPKSTRSPNIPDADRTFITAGASYTFSDMISASLGYGHFFFAKAPINLTKTVARGAVGQWSTNLKGRIKAAVDIVNAQVSFKF